MNLQAKFEYFRSVLYCNTENCCVVEAVLIASPPRNGASSGCVWRRIPPCVEGRCECIEYAVWDI
jgi:hypothetical protein